MYLWREGNKLPFQFLSFLLLESGQGGVISDHVEEGSSLGIIEEQGRRGMDP